MKGRGSLKKPSPAVQFGALPYRVTRDRGLEFLLITTKQSQRWIIPKGAPIKGLKPARSAAREAFEEAGVRGAVREKSIGSFRFHKTREASSDLLCEVKVYALQVKQQTRKWPELGQRRQSWFRPADAQAAVKDRGLQLIIAKFAAARSAKSDIVAEADRPPYPGDSDGQGAPGFNCLSCPRASASSSGVGSLDDRRQTDICVV